MRGTLAIGDGLMKTLWQQILPLLQAIRDEGGNFVDFQISSALLPNVGFLEGHQCPQMARACR